MEQHYVGIDVSQSKLDVKLDDGKPSIFENSKRGIRKLVKALEERHGSFVVLEATGGYEKALRVELQRASVTHSVVNPLRIRQFARSCGIAAKTDSIDAEVIRRYGIAVKPEPTPMADESTQEIRALVERRDELVRFKSAEKARLKGPANSKALKESIRRSICFLEKEVASIDLQLNEAVEKSELFKRRLEIVTTIPSIGKTLGICILATVPELGTIDNKAVAALCGTAPFNHDSGNSKGRRFTSGGRVRARCALYIAALVACRYNKPLAEFYKRLKSNGKPSNVALVAVMRKLIVRINAMLRDMTPWSDDIPQLLN